MFDATSLAVDSLPPWVHDFARRLAPSTQTTTLPLPSSQPSVVISTEAELEAYVWGTFGVRIPSVRVCSHHQSPWEAFCAGYFATAEKSVIVIKGSRAFAGKSWLLALLGTVIATTMRGDVTILGGSAIQSARVHRAMDKFWAAPNAPRDMLRSEIGAETTTFKDGHTIEALTASQKSARGPHSLALLLDEIDEMDWKLYEAATGITMDANGFTGRTVIASTHQHADGPMTKILALAAERHWRVFNWCWRETLEPNGWLSQSQVNRKRGEMTAEMWRIEVELGEPSIEDRAIFTEKVERMFIGGLIDGDGVEFAYREFEAPDAIGHYVTGADWARSRDFVEIVTLRDDVYPLRLVAYQRFRRRPTHYMVERFEHQASRYPGEALHDATSLGGKIMDDFVATDEWQAVGSTVSGFDFGKHRERQNMFTDWIIAIEAEEVVSPRIGVLYNQYKYVRNEDLRSGGSGHPPDGFVAGAMAYRISQRATKPLRLRTSQPSTPPGPGDGGLGRLRAFLAGSSSKGNGDG